jgi:hypothetical protein
MLWFFVLTVGALHELRRRESRLGKYTPTGGNSCNRMALRITNITYNPHRRLNAEFITHFVDARAESETEQGS